MSFDIERKGTGTAEWAEVTENICRGCRNDCLYCYAANSANRFNLRKREQWATEELTKRAEITSYPARNGVVMFPSSHDISPYNLEAYIRVAKLILEKGNRLLIVSKPRADCIYPLLAEVKPWIDNILLRFTIGTISEVTSRFWEPGATLPKERINVLRAAFSAGFSTSVSIEPMLAGRFGAMEVFHAVCPYVTETVWIGKMNKTRLRVDKQYQAAVDNILEMQRDDEIIRLVDDLKAYRQIRWKDSINEVIARMAPQNGPK